MEGIIVIIIVIIAFNLLSVFLRAIKGERGSQRVDIPSAKENPSVDETEVKNFGEVETTRFRAKKPENAYSDQEFDDEEHKKYTGVTVDKAISPPDESEKTSEVASNLKKMLSQKESLAAAVVFHEILKHPPSMRRGK